MYNFRLTGNRKTGPIPVTRSPGTTCPDNCVLKSNGCYAENAPLAWHWAADTTKGITWEELIYKIKHLPRGQLWRHNEAGDLPAGFKDNIDWEKLQDLIRANKGKKGFTYTHYPIKPGLTNHILIVGAISQGFTINASADNMAMADVYRNLGLPTVVILPIDAANVSYTPAGNKVVACPAEKSDKVTCASCALCQEPYRNYIIGFRAHGSHRKTVEKIIARVPQ